MSRALKIGGLVGLLLSFLSWIATLMTDAFPGGWVLVLEKAVLIVAAASWVWCGVATARGERSRTAGAMSGLMAAAVYGLLAGSVSTLFFSPAADQLATGQRLVSAFADILAPLIPGALLGFLGAVYYESRQARQAEPGSSSGKGE